MIRTHAAVVTSFDEPPHYIEFELPDTEEHDLVDVLAVGLHPRVRSGASGSHYSSAGTLPMIPGVDGVARRQDGSLVYFVGDDDVLGTMAGRVYADPRRCVDLPADADVPRIAASMNPAMSGWVALRRRVPLQAGQSVLVLGATGNAGSMAVRIAKHFGAGRVVAAGRDSARLAALTETGADTTVELTDDTDATGRALADAAADVDIVLDYLWGQPAQAALLPLLTARGDRSRALDWIQIGSVAGSTIELPSVALRSANLRLLGVGQGSVSPTAYVAELASLVEAIDSGVIGVDPDPVRLADVEAVWTRPDVPGRRTVLVP